MKEDYTYIFLTTIIFSTMEIALKLVTGSFNPIEVTFIRFFVGGLFLMPFALKALIKKNLSIDKEDYIFFALLGFLGTTISMGLYQLSVLYTKASVVAVLFSCNPVFVTISSYFLLKEAIYTNNIIALILEILGSVIIINPLSTKLDPLGITLTIASTLTFALYGVCGKKKCAKYGGIVVTCFNFIFGSLEMLMLILLTHIESISEFFLNHNLQIFSKIPLSSGFTMSTLPVMIYICIINTGIGYACYFKALEKTSATKTSLVFFFKPILAPILALIILKESLSFNMLIGILLILCGSMTSILPSLKNNKNIKLKKAA
ncbi:Permease of the drug/metabolite transporter (DMT) superfamily [Clostridium sp. DSM 8431]|uniref:DMT family transporter n=1 Tax=Clostridium sp. DSM 8431 TaxID=1761781 RepID=UPI0008E8E2A0|nr:DMT family transporter [Clostridium sp. DSM 8431]SFU35238.1 Permease of the drug/metabolite transporter (DMT) superfamily [Clostridium sp. DSM 8431]